jgi:hypothetical protein
MSAIPLTRPPRPGRSSPARAPLRVVSPRAQRRARPRAGYAIASIGGVFAILLVQLALSIVLSDGAYRLTALEVERAELDRSAQILTERLNVYDSAQNVAANAETLGMVVSSVSPAFLLLADSTVQGAATPAGTGAGVVQGRSDLVGNVLLAGVPAPAVATASAPMLVVSGVPSPLSTAESVPSATGGVLSPVMLPSPVTR